MREGGGIETTRKEGKLQRHKKKKKEERAVKRKERGVTVFLKEGWTELIKGSITNHHGAVDKKLENKKGKETYPSGHKTRNMINNHTVQIHEMVKSSSSFMQARKHSSLIIREKI